MSYISRDIVMQSLRRMVDYHRAQRELHEQFGIDFLANRGRRNVIMSQAQEEFFANELSKAFKGVRSDGRPGAADIYVGELERELECKITSPTQSTGAFSFQTDYATLAQKGELDYLYIISDHNFKNFCALYFEGLTVDDFRVPGPGARGRAQMIKHMGMKKCTVLHGQALNLCEERAKRLQKSLTQMNRKERRELNENVNLLSNLKVHYENGTDPRSGLKTTARRKREINKRIKTAELRPDKIKKKFNNRRKRVRSEIAASLGRPGRFTFVLEPLPEDESLVS